VGPVIFHCLILFNSLWLAYLFGHFCAHRLPHLCILHSLEQELIVRKKVFDAVLKEAEKASTLLDQNDDSRNDDKDKDGKDDGAEKTGEEIKKGTGSVASSSSSSSSSFANRLSGAPPPPLPLDKQHAHYLLDWRWA